ncbi:MAG: hypothetical protein JJU05_06245 [Verrucomicrobia bacterium]|nr:hypothetical protein [Verrucomicrobiota bacterium]MCH8525758.1 hypothetical protein [Kiritimatiellia bacterium]
MRFHRFYFLTLLTGTVLSASAAEITHTVQNPLRQRWPWDLTHIEVPAAQAEDLTIAELSGHIRPVQIETLSRNGESVSRAWFVATIDQREQFTDDRGRNTEGVIREAPLTLRSGSIRPGIHRSESGPFHVIDNGTYEVRIRQSETFDEPIPFHKAPHWFGGGRVKGQSEWDGRAWFDGDALVSGIRTEILQEGPVFIDLSVTYDFVAETDGTTPALPLDLGKQTHTWEPNTPPREDIPKLDHAYELRIRLVMGAPWIEVNERYHLPRSEAAGPFGVHQHWINWGEPADAPDVPGFSPEDQMPVDTVTWVRWFLYDQFGGNVTQHYVPARPRDDQRGRPFALLRPRWNQGGGGAQDFFLTSGGPNPDSIQHMINRPLQRALRDLNRDAERDEEKAEQKARIDAWLEIATDTTRGDRERFEAIAEVGRELEVDLNLPEPGYSGDNPAVGIVAAFPSKWVGPFPATIAAYAHDENRGRARFPLIDGERSQMHYGQRAFAICIGPRSEFTWLNDLVRRHTDWTLVALMNKYILEWDRDPELAGPNLFITRERLEELRSAYRSGAGAEAEIFAEELDAFKALRDERDELREVVSALNETRSDRSLPQEERERANKEHRERNQELRGLENRLDSPDMHILQLITDPDFSRTVEPQDAGLWLERRYQDDFLNPTSRATRNVKLYAEADLFAGGSPVGGPLHAALGYVKTDLDAWPGWHQGWSPGNPNFHTDKYMGAIYIAAAMRDHPHSDDWLQYGWANFQEDLQKVLFEPDGVGYECPGYAGYALKLQLDLARIFTNVGFTNPVTDNPLFKGSGIWHRKLITPYNERLQRRHTAPIGDTHRWDSGLGHGFGMLATFYSDEDPEFAEEMMGAWRLLTDNGLQIRNPLRTQLIDADPSIPAMDPMDMDWSSDTFHGFGAIFRNNFGTGRESFLTVKAGPTRGHYHNDELTYHFYSHGQPISLDYNCSYTPRGDHAALHNSMTFGREGTVLHNAREERVPAMEQIFSTAHKLAFAGAPEMDVFVAERKSSTVHLTPIYPEDHEFQRNYGEREVHPITHRRYISMVKQPEDSPVTDYLVVRDETVNREGQAVNIHLLSRDLTVDGNLILARGQGEMDMALYVADAADLEIDVRHWWYSDTWIIGPGDEYTIRPGESMDEWAERMKAFKAEHNVDTLPLPGWRAQYRPRDWNEPGLAWQKLLQETDGKAMIPPEGWTGPWMFGEYQQWVRLNTRPGTPVLWVLYPYPRGTEPPAFETLEDGKGVRVTVNGQTEDIFLNTDPGDTVPGQAVIRRNGQEHILLDTGTVPAL